MMNLAAVLMLGAATAQPGGAPAWPLCSDEQIAQWNDTWKTALGVAALDPGADAQNLFSDPKDPWPPATDGVHDWPPFHPTKTTYCGTVSRYAVFVPAAGLLHLVGIEEHDLTVNVLPNASSADLLDEAAEHFPEGIVDSCRDGASDRPCIHAEITPHKQFPRDEDGWRLWLGRKDQSGLAPSQRTEICLYGPHVADTGHDSHAEIHPIQLMWLRGQDGRSLVFFLLQDASGRFNRRRQFRHMHRPDKWQAWAASPLRGRFEVAFRSEPGKRPSFRLSQLLARKVVSASAFPELKPPPPELRLCHPDVAAEASGNCRTGEEPVITLEIPPETASRIRDVQIEGLCQSGAGGELLGYVVFQTAVGDRGCGGEGFQVLTLTDSTSDSTAARAIGGTPLAEAVQTAEAASSIVAPSPPTEEASATPAASGKESAAAPPEVVLGVALASMTPVQTKAMKDRAEAAGAWHGFLESAWRDRPVAGSPAPPGREVAAGDGTRAAARGVHVPIERIREWEFFVRPHYSGPGGYDLQDAISENDAGLLRARMGLVGGHPLLQTTWSDCELFASDGTRANATVLCPGSVKPRDVPLRDAVRVDEATVGGSVLESGIRVRFPESLGAGVFELRFRVTLTDPLGRSAQQDHSLWTHVLVADRRSARALIGALDPSVVKAAEGAGARAAVANDLINSVARAGKTRFLSVEDLRAVIRRIGSFARRWPPGEVR
jgi:hypothetical protein